MNSSAPASAHSREELRGAYVEAWRKHRAGAPLTPLEAMLTDVIGLHPEYQGMLEEAGTSVEFEGNAVRAAENPFLHLGLHMAVREQAAIDRPPGVRDLRRRLEARFGSAHDAEHAMMEALAETLWEAQRTGGAPDEGRYVERARARLHAT
jgi:hypothetical protein